MKKFTFMAALVLASTTSAQSEPKLIGNYGKWSAYQVDGICFAACQPESSEGNYTKRGDTFLMVSYRPKDKVSGELSSLMGYTINTNAPAEMIIDGKSKYVLQTTEEAAFVDNDVEVIQAMKKGGKLVVHATSSRGTLTTDNYSLTGFTKASQAAANACK